MMNATKEDILQNKIGMNNMAIAWEDISLRIGDKVELRVNGELSLTIVFDAFCNKFNFKREVMEEYDSFVRKNLGSSVELFLIK